MYILKSLLCGDGCITFYGYYKRYFFLAGGLKSPYWFSNMADLLYDLIITNQIS